MRKRKDVPAEKVDALEKEVRVWSPACSVFWALWGIVQGEAQVRGIVEKSTEPAEFDYLVSLVLQTSLISVICH
jgi:choline kinase